MTGLVSQKAEIVRDRDNAGARVWRIDLTTTDDKGFVTRTTVAERADMRSILGDALVLEKQGVPVARGGLARGEIGGSHA